MRPSFELLVPALQPNLTHHSSGVN